MTNRRMAALKERSYQANRLKVSQVEMTNSNFSGYALAICVAGLSLSGCGGSAAGVTESPAVEVGPVASFSKTFKFTGGSQTFRVPNGVTKLDVVARGAAGGGETCYSSCRGETYFGRGGRVYAVIPVRPGEKLYVFVGGEGSRENGGFNGGGNGGAYSLAGYGGGGASDVREHGDRAGDRILVAAGGGGQGNYRFAVGGSGGGKVGGAGGSINYGSYDYGGGGGTGGTQNGGGSGGTGGIGDSGNNGTPGSPGAFGTGGSGGLSGYNPDSYGGSGGGGGGGYYGGGGGGGGGAAFASIYGGPGGGGGGGSSYIEPKASKFQTWPGWKNATTNGLVVFSWQ